MHPVPFNDQYRLEELNLFGILDTEQESCFDNLTSLARRYFGAPIALVSLVDECRQWSNTKGLGL